MTRRRWTAYVLGTTHFLDHDWSLPRLVRRVGRYHPRLQAAYYGSPLRGVPLALALALVLPPLVLAQAQTPPGTSMTVDSSQMNLAQFNGKVPDVRIAADTGDETRICVDEAMTRCVTVGEIRALARADGEIGVLDQLRRELLSAQFLLTQANQRALQDQLEAWVADLERRHPGWTYDRQTGALVKAPPPTPEKKPGGGADE